MKPMLAHRYAEHKHKLTYPCYVQPKINGVRGIYHNGVFQSRDEHIWMPDVVAHLTAALSVVPPTVILDGELYVHGWPLQKINSAISINRLEPSAFTPHIQYHVFDMIYGPDISLDFRDRLDALRELFSKITSPSISLLDTHYITSEIEGDQFFQHFKSLAYEGMMYRADASYGLSEFCTNKENRWPILLKRKDFLDANCLIVDVELGEGKYSDAVGSLVLRFPDNNRLFRAGSGLSDMQRTDFLDSPPIGHYARINYEMLSVDGIPLKPTIEAIL